MTQAAMDQPDWMGVIEAHPLESHDPQQWLCYGVALLQTIENGPEAGKRQQQAALAFVQAQKEGAPAEAVMAAQRHSVLCSLQEALQRADLVLPEQFWASASGLTQAQASAAREPPIDPLGVLTGCLARAFALDLPQQASVLDQLLAAKEQLRNKQVDSAAIEQALQQEVDNGGQAWMEALHKVLLVLR